MISAQRIVLGFEYADGQIGFGCTSAPLVYVCRVFNGTYRSKRVRCDGALRWAFLTEGHEAGIRLRDFLHALSTDEARSTAGELSAPPETIASLASLAEVHEAAIAEGDLTAGSDAGWSLLAGLQFVSVVDEIDADADADPTEVAVDETVIDCPFVPLPAIGSGRDDVALWADLQPQSFELAIFDLDGTLLDTSALEAVRSARRWAEVESRLDEVAAFATWGLRAPHDVAAELRDYDKQVAVVTRSPEWYARAVLARFGIECDHLRAACGSNKVAAFREVIAAAGCDGQRDTIVFGDDFTDFEAAYALGIWSFGNPFVNRAMRHQAMPDVCWWDAETLLACEAWRPALTYVGEAFDGYEPIWHRGSLVPIDEDAWALGRYFSTVYAGEGHGRRPRHHDHPLSQAVLDQKNTPSRVPRIADAFDQAILRLDEAIGIDVVASVPPAAEKVDRFQAYVHTACEMTGAEALDVIEAKPAPRGYKQLSESQRRALRDGRFVVDNDLGGATVLVIDDVFNTGSTLGAVRDAAWESGAGRVLQLAFAANQKR